MGFLRTTIAAFVVSLLSATLHALPVTINGATFDAPAVCKLAEGALVCKEDGQQLELWVYRKPLSPTIAETDPLAKKMAHFNDLHESAAANIMRSTGNDKTTPFSTYGRYIAAGSAMAGKGSVNAPTARFASVLSGGEVWQFLEVVATRTPAIEAIATALQRSLVLPGTTMVASVETAAQPAANPAVATHSGTLLSFQYPRYLEPFIAEDSATGFNAGFKRTGRDGGPNMTVSLLAPKDKQATAVAAMSQRKQTSMSAMVDGSASVPVNRLGTIPGEGYALIGTPDAKKGLSGIESIETTFFAEVGGRLLEVRLTAEQKYSSELEEVWTLLTKSMKLSK